MKRAAVLLFVLAACGTSSNGGDTPAPSAQPTTAPTSTAPVKDAGPKDAGSHPSARLQDCAAAKGGLDSIADATTRLNSLVAKGGDQACFVATLPRPLAVVATLNQASAQPAGGRAAPRIFFMLPKLVISAVPEGAGSKVLEFGEWTGTTSTIKGELPIPVTAALAPDTAYKKILNGPDRTLCANCHRAEERHATIPNAFVSGALKPSSVTEVPLEDLEELHRLCITSGLESPRCDFIHALFDFGELTQGAFSAAVPTFN